MAEAARDGASRESIVIGRVLPYRWKSTAIPTIRSCGARRRSAQEIARGVLGHPADLTTPGGIERCRLLRSWDAVPDQGSSAQAASQRIAWAKGASSSAEW